MPIKVIYAKAKFKLKIVGKEKFSEKYRNPLLNNNLLNERNSIKEEKYNIIKEDIISGKSILNYY